MNFLLTEHESVVLSDAYMDRTKAHAVPGAYYSSERKAHVVTNPTARAARAAITLFPHVLIDNPELAEIAESDYGAAARPEDYASKLRMTLGDVSLGPGTLHDWQDMDVAYLTAILESSDHESGVAMGWDRGLGKTAATAAIIQKLDIQRTVVVCRNDTKVSVWQRQLAEEAYPGASKGWLPDWRIVVIPNPKDQREKLLARIAEGEFDELPWVFVIHYQAIPLVAGDKTITHKDGKAIFRKGAGEGWSKLGRFGLQVYDESHRLANYNPNSGKNPQFGRGLAKMRRNSDMAINLSGSLLTNRPEGMFGQLHHIQPKTYKAKWADWNDPFLDFVEVEGRRVCIGFQTDKLQHLRKELGVFMVYRKKEEVLESLPPLIHSNIMLPMLSDQKKAYEDVRDNTWATIENEGIVAANPMSYMHTLRRIATAWPGVGSAKLDYCVHELEAAPDEQFVVFTWYKEPGHLLAERLGDQVVVVDGDVAPKHRPELLRRHEAGHVRVLVGSIETLGESLNLQYMHEAIRLDRDWDPEKNGQTIDRLHRQGQQVRVTMHDLWTPHTVDTLKVWPNLRSKQIARKALFP